MRRVRRSAPGGPFETLSDLAVGALGVFIILVVVLTIMSGSHSSVFEKHSQRIKEENATYEAEVIRSREAVNDFKASNTKTINELETEHENTKRQLDKTRERLKSERRRLQEKEERFEEVTSTVNVIEQQRKLHADYVAEMDKLNIQLKSLADRNTGHGVDRTGRAHIKYGTFTPSQYVLQEDTVRTPVVLIGKEGIFTLEKWAGFLKSAGDYGGVSSFMVSFSNSNSKYKQDNSRPQWSRDLHAKLGWKPTPAPIKPGY